jgi:hypothetical protein
MSKSGKTIAMLLAMTFMVACAGPSLQMARAYGGVVYASYYQLDGSLNTSALVLEGLDR